MLMHIAILRRRVGVAREPDFECQLVRRLRGLGGVVGGVVALTVRTNDGRRPTAWDYLLQAEFADESALERFLQHPAQREAHEEATSYFEVAQCRVRRP